MPEQMCMRVLYNGRFIESRSEDLENMPDHCDVDFTNLMEYLTNDGMPLAEYDFPGFTHNSNGRCTDMTYFIKGGVQVRHVSNRDHNVTFETVYGPKNRMQEVFGIMQKARKNGEHR